MSFSSESHFSFANMMSFLEEVLLHHDCQKRKRKKECDRNETVLGTIKRICRELLLSSNIYINLFDRCCFREMRIWRNDFSKKMFLVAYNVL